MNALPNLFLFAAPRSGSTQLSAWLSSHPDIALPPIKEPNYFAREDFPPPDDPQLQRLLDVTNPLSPRARGNFALLSTIADYASLYDPIANTRWRLDASTSYLASTSAAAEIARTCPDARIITLTRDPVARAISHYGLARRTGRTRASLTSEIATERAHSGPPILRYLLRPSQQTAALARLRAVFPPERCLHIQFDTLITAPGSTLLCIACFLGIAPQGFDRARIARNASALPRCPPLAHLLHRAGWHAPLRHALPPAAKAALRPLWFRNATPAMSPQEHAVLTQLLEGA